MITIDLGTISRDEVLSSIRELDREQAARCIRYPKLVADGKLCAAAVEQRRLSLAIAREIVACVARGMIADDNTATVVHVLPVLPKVDTAEGGVA